MFLSPFELIFWANFVYFIFTIFLAFFIPGDTLLRTIKLPIFQRAVLSTLLGMAVWIWQGFTFGYLNIRFATYGYIVIFAIIWLYQNKNIANRFTEKWFFIKRTPWLTTLLLILGVTIQLSTVWLTGIKVYEGAFFCCGNNSDALYHIALTDQIIKSIPPQEPGMYGVVVHNYHYLSNVVVAELVRVFHLPLVATHYQFMTFFISLFLGLTAISFSKSNNLSRAFMNWLLFFLYFGGDFIYLLLILLGKGFSFKMSSLEDGSLFLVNPPRAFAIVMFFCFLSMLSLWLRNKSMRLAILTGIVAATLIGLKVYLGIFTLPGLLLLTIFYLFKKDYKLLAILSIALLGSLLFYLPVNSGAGGIYFTQLWIFENFISQPQLGLIRMEMARSIYKDHNNYFRIVQYEAMYIAIYFFAIFGTKLLGFIQSKKSLLFIPVPIHFILLTGLLTSCVGGFLFQQTSGGANSFNFIVSIFVISSIYTALSISYWQKKLPHYIALLLGMAIILLTLPRVINSFASNIDHIFHKKNLIITNTQLEALEQLRVIGDDKNLVLVLNSFSEDNQATPFVSFITDKPLFISGITILESHGVNTKAREKVKLQITRDGNEAIVAKNIKDNNIHYILLSPFDNIASTESAEFLHTVFSNKEAKILEVSQNDLKNFLLKEKIRNNNL